MVLEEDQAQDEVLVLGGFDAARSLLAASKSAAPLGFPSFRFVMGACLLRVLEGGDQRAVPSLSQTGKGVHSGPSYGGSAAAHRSLDVYRKESPVAVAL
jgi:hypothetical protein